MPIIRVMKFRERGKTSTLILVASLALLLPLLAVFQYRWLAQLSEREQEHMKANLRATATRFGQDFDDELTRAFAVFFPSPDLGKDDGLAPYAARHDRWLTVAQYPRLVKDVLVAHADEKNHMHLHQLNTDLKQFVSCDWPSELSALRQQLERQLAGEPPAFNRDLMSRRLRPVNDETMAFIHPILVQPALDQRGQRVWTAPPPPLGFVVVTISLAEIRQEILPSLAKRHFYGADSGVQGFDYSAAVVTPAPEPKIIYQFGPEAGNQTEADVDIGLMGLRREVFARMVSRFRGAEEGPFLRALPPSGGAAAAPNRPRGPSPRGMGGLPPFNEEQKLWSLRLTHRAGSLEAAVKSIRRRNLLISFSILALLAATIALLVHSTRRAQRLARREMDFVAGVSHELRTPLAVIKSAAWSLTRGVVREEEQIKRYSELIGKESDRLIEMIEQVLEFAGARSGRQKLELQPVDPADLIDAVLASSQPLLSAGGFQIEKEFAPDLPQVMADASALSRALRNLIDNAMKYSGENRWIGVQAHAPGDPGGRGIAEVRITISDRGLGIPAQDLKHIFDPFWRGAEATAAQIHGNGLGLNLVKTIINAHGGGVSVQSEQGQGSSFTLTLPATARTVPQPAPAHSFLDTSATG
ncbi:MAG TPA: HAMP domain-containing sensor histidine kinase [Blastocatellia bacterium]|nr:HAMP domain-containing sensor histidine kinase [Blastocatellia bacterium]